MVQVILKNQNNRIDFMDLPRSIYGPIKDFDLRNRGSVRERKSYINDRILGCPENAMRCSEMVEVVE